MATAGGQAGMVGCAASTYACPGQAAWASLTKREATTGGDRTNPADIDAVSFASSRAAGSGRRVRVVW